MYSKPTSSKSLTSSAFSTTLTVNSSLDGSNIALAKGHQVFYPSLLGSPPDIKTDIKNWLKKIKKGKVAVDFNPTKRNTPPRPLFYANLAPLQLLPSFIIGFFDLAL